MEEKNPWIIRYIGGMLHGAMESVCSSKEEAEKTTREHSDYENTGSGYVIV